MISSIIYNDQTRSFTQYTITATSPGVNTSAPYAAPRTGSKTGEIAKIIGVAAAINLIPAVIKIITRHYGNKVKDNLLDSRNTRINTLSDNYKSDPTLEKVTPELSRKYRDEIHKLYQETVQLVKSSTPVDERNDGDLYITISQDRENRFRSASKSKVGKDSILEQYINPLFVVLRMILINQVHILAGTNIGADRRSFELVFDSDRAHIDDVARNPFRNVLFKYPWPAHGFEVSTRGQAEANKFINAVIDYLAENPKYLAIRVR